MEIIENTTLGFKLEYTRVNDKIWIRGNQMAEQLQYSRPNKAIATHVPNKHKSELKSLIQGTPEWCDQKKNQPHTKMVSFPTGALYLLGASHTEKGEQFRQWMYEEVIPTIMKTGRYELQPVKITENKTIHISSEKDLQKYVISFLRQNQNKYHLNIVVPLGELQDTSEKRITARTMGYEKGQPDIIINNQSIKNSGVIVELKSPQGNGKLSPEQINIIQRYREDNYKCIVSNDLCEIISKLTIYFTNLRLPCQYCNHKFRTEKSRQNHYKYFHRINN